jgi:hypothetical protein
MVLPVWPHTNLTREAEFRSLIIFFVGLYGAIEPGVYKRGFLYLIPPERRGQIAQVISECNETLKWWLIGKFFGMAVIGVFTTAGLWLLDVPLAFILGLIAALFTFIPNLGPILAAFPAVLLGMTVSPEQALYMLSNETTRPKGGCMADVLFGGVKTNKKGRCHDDTCPLDRMVFSYRLPVRCT